MCACPCAHSNPALPAGTLRKPSRTEAVGDDGQVVDGLGKEPQPVLYQITAMDGTVCTGGSISGLMDICCACQPMRQGMEACAHQWRLAALRSLSGTPPSTCSWPAPCALWPWSACAWRRKTAALRNGRPGRYGEGRRWGQAVRRAAAAGGGADKAARTCSSCNAQHVSQERSAEATASLPMKASQRVAVPMPSREKTRGSARMPAG